MANINKIKAQGNVYDIEDTVARSSAVTVSSKTDGTVELKMPNLTVTLPSLTNFGDPSELENDVVTEISDLKSQIAQLEAIPKSVKLAMDTLFQNMAVKDDAVYSDEYAVIHAWATSVNVVSINAVYTPSGTVYEGDSVEDLRNDLVVTATMDNSTTAVVTTYTLSGELVKGTSTITVTYEGVSTSFTVTVAEYAWTYTSDMGLLSTQDFVASFDKTNLSALSEVATSDGLNLSFTGSSALNGKNANYAFAPSTFLNEAVFKFSIKFHALMYIVINDPTYNGALHFRISNGTEGATISFARYGTATASPKIRYRVGDDFVWGSEISLDTWHDIEVYIRNGKQTIKVDGQVEAENVNLSTAYTTANKFFVFGSAQSLDMSLDNIKFGWQ